VTVNLNTEFSDFCIQEVVPLNNPVLLNLSAVFNVICYMIMLSFWRLHSFVDRWLNGYGAVLEWYWQRESKHLGEKPVLESLCPLQIQHGLAWDQTSVLSDGTVLGIT